MDLPTLKLVTGIVADVLTIITVIAGIYFAWPLYRAALLKLKDEVEDVIKKD